MERSLPFLRYSLVSSFLGLAILVSVLLCGARSAAAQTTIINQTSCVGNCLTNGFLQDLFVDCNAGQHIFVALASIADRNGPNRITVSGTCAEPLSVVGFNRLTIQGTPATITRGFSAINSRSLVLRSLTFDFASALGSRM